MPWFDSNTRYESWRTNQHKYAIPVFGATIQYAKAADTSNNLDDDSKKFIPQVNGTLLYYARTMDPPILAALSTIESSQAAPTEATIYK